MVRGPPAAGTNTHCVMKSGWGFSHGKGLTGNLSLSFICSTEDFLSP